MSKGSEQGIGQDGGEVLRGSVGEAVPEEMGCGGTCAGQTRWDAQFCWMREAEPGHR